MVQRRKTINGCVFRKDISILFDPSANSVVQLENTALEIVESMAQGASVEETASELAQKYSVDYQMVREDIEAFWGEVKTAPADQSAALEKSMVRIPDFPLNLEIALTKACNLKCSFCHDSVLSSNSSFGLHMPPGAVKRILEDAASYGLLRARYSGGEPTLYPDLEEILRYGKDLGLYQVIFTNGMNVTSRQLKSWKELNVGEVLMSLHGCEATHDRLTGNRGAFKKVIAAIGLAMDAGLGVVVEMTLTSQNECEVCAVIDLIKNLGVQEFRLMRYVARGVDDSLFALGISALMPLIDKLERRYDGEKLTIQFPCSQRFCLSDSNIPFVQGMDFSRRLKYLTQNCFAGLNWASVAHDGSLRLCPHSERVLADLHQFDFRLSSVWKEMVAAPVKAVLDKRPADCRMCTAWGGCLGGCYMHIMDHG
jgi:AdoMet-dependent heme synthase